MKKFLIVLGAICSIAYSSAHASFIGITLPPYSWNFDRIDCGEIAGWACDTSLNQHPVQIHIYKNAPAGQGGILVTGAPADDFGEAAIGAACNGSPNRRFTIPASAVLQGQTSAHIYMYLVDTVSGYNTLIQEATIGGCFTATPTPVPTPTPTPVVPKKYISGDINMDCSGRVSGFACVNGWNRPQFGCPNPNLNAQVHVYRDGPFYGPNPGTLIQVGTVGNFRPDTAGLCSGYSDTGFDFNVNTQQLNGTHTYFFYYVAFDCAGVQFDLESSGSPFTASCNAGPLCNPAGAYQYFGKLVAAPYIPWEDFNLVRIQRTWKSAVNLTCNTTTVVTPTPSPTPRFTSTPKPTPTPPGNTPPVVSITQSLISQCVNNTTNVSLNGSASFDPQGLPLSYFWTTNCPDSVLLNPTQPLAILVLNGPGKGISVSCTVTLTASDGVLSNSVSQSVSAAACGSVDCKGVPNGTSVVDLCGVCGGNNACVDCKGVVNGPAKVDSCGVCGGDGSSCNQCSNQDVSDTAVALDTNTIQQKNNVITLLKRLQKLGGSKVTPYVTQTRKAVTDLQVELWTEVWTKYPNPVVNCTSSSTCVSVSTQGTLTTFRAGSARLELYSKQVAVRIRPFTGRKTRPSEQKLLNQAARLHQENIALLSGLPKSTSSCTK